MDDKSDILIDPIHLLELLELVVGLIDESNIQDYSSDTPEMTKLRKKALKVIRKKIKIPEVKFPETDI